jgi:hypothetical protein
MVSAREENKNKEGKEVLERVYNFKECGQKKI